MESRFHVAKGRYQAFSNSRFKQYTYGENKIIAQEVEQDNIQNLENETHGTYAALLFDQRWLSKRKEILERDTNQCILCGNQNKLQVHHRQYHLIKATGTFKPPWDYDNHLLITLCESCHKRGHSTFKVPIIKI